MGSCHPFTPVSEYVEKIKDLKFIPKKVCSAVFANLAHLHVKFCEDKSLMNEKWVKSADFMLGKSIEY